MKYLACFLLCGLMPSLAVAQDDDEDTGPPLEINQVGMTLGAGAGYGMPFGDTYKATSLTDVTGLDSSVSAKIPVVLHLGARPISYLSFGVAFQYAPLITKNCDVGATCSASDTYIGMELRLHLIPDQVFCPWISFGLGYEWFSISETRAQTTVDGGFRGQAYDIEFGADIRVTRFLALGPYVGVRFGSYGTVHASNNSLGDSSIPDDQQAMHGWWVFGVRGAFTISMR